MAEANQELSFKTILFNNGPGRYISFSSFISAIGDGLYYVCSALFFLRVLNLSPTELGIGLTISWGISFFVSVPIGKLADRFGSRVIALIALFFAAMASFAMIYVQSLLTFILVATTFAIASNVASNSLRSLLAEYVPQQQRTKMRAVIVSLVNAGLAIGSGIGGIILFFDSAEYYHFAFIINGISFLFSCCMIISMGFMKSMQGKPKEEKGPEKVDVWKNKSFVAATFFNFFLCLHFPLIDIAIPIWVMQYTDAPLYMVSAVFMINTTMVVFLQFHTAKKVNTLDQAKVTLRKAGFWLFLGSVSYALSSQFDQPILAGLCLAVGAVLFTLGEMRQTVSTTEISYALTPEGKHGSYQAFYGLSAGLGEVAAPLLLTSIIIALGWYGWILLGLVLLAATFLMPLCVDWARKAEPSLIGR